MFDHGHAECAQVLEEALRMPDAGDGMHGLAAECSGRACLPGLQRDAGRRPAASSSRPMTCPANAAGTAAPLTTTRSTDARRADGFAQWTGRKQCRIAESTRRIHHDDLQVTLQGQVLQAVVGDHELASLLRQQPRRLDAAARDADGNTATRHQQRPRHRLPRHRCLPSRAAGPARCRRSRGSQCRRELRASAAPLRATA